MRLMAYGFGVSAGFEDHPAGLSRMNVKAEALRLRVAPRVGATWHSRNPSPSGKTPGRIQSLA